jgi:tRNA G18 (ribose-2'-O)-methylase SpoU
MGSVFSRPPARGDITEVQGFKLALNAHASADLREVELEPPVVLCLGAEREGLAVGSATDGTARIPMRSDGPESLNVAAAAAVALYEVATRMAGRA